VALGDGFHDGKAEAGASRVARPARVAAPEPLERVLEDFVVEPDPESSTATTARSPSHASRSDIGAASGVWTSAFVTRLFRA
jgi:hypothetical protein